ncbi:TRAP transporter large permease subunit [Rhizobiales bacterium L72]|uniref:TRAP transporter large permease subunit n=2 Tax=Propylenella binzhouense TaxID=2555902 RepID=A0A964T1L5_9HYPH|nr:TRAP transporter large permease subunit [Propylenella binzhouense]
MICADIVLRFFFSAPINGVTDIVSYVIVACVFLQIGSTIRDNRLIRADFLFGTWAAERPGFARVLDLAFFGVASLLLWRALGWLWRDFLGSYATGEFTGAVGAYQITIWPFKLAVVVGCAVALVETVWKAAAAAFDLARRERLRSADAFPVFAFLTGVAVFLYLNFEVASSPVSVGLLSLAGLLVAVAIGMPIAFALLVLSFVGVWLTRHNPVVADNALGIAASGAIRSYEFGVVPLFVMMGLLLDKADVGRDAFQVAVSLLRRIRGGLGIATVAANAVFASITGSSIASAAVFSRIAVPPMIEGGYTARFAVGVVAGSSVLGMLIPPSLLLIIYGLVAEASIGKLFVAAIIPGLLLAGAFALLNVLMASFFPRFVGRPHEIEGDGMTPGQVVLRLAPVVGIVALVMGGIYAGMFTPTEAGAVGALGAFLVGALRRKLTLPTIRRIVLETGYISAAILFLIVAANLYGRMLTLSTIPMKMTAFVAELGLGMPLFLAFYFAVVLLLGMILDSTSIMLIMLPIVLPIVTSFGGDPVWFGIVTVIAVEVGLLTPPFGLSVFVVKSSLPPGFVTLGDIFAGSAPFVVTMILVTVLVMAFPQISLVLL